MDHRLVVFINGVHGVGKGHLCKILAPIINAEHITASSLIGMRKSLGSAKPITGIDANQSILVEEFRLLESSKNTILLDGHFCLFDSELRIQYLPIALFRALDVAHVISLTCSPQTAKDRLEKRDGEGLGLALKCITELQLAESRHSRMVASELGLSMSELDTTKELSFSKIHQIATTIKGLSKR